MKIKCTKLYKFDELSEDAKEHAIEKLYDINVDYDGWYEFIFDDAKEIAKLMGIEIKNIYFNGFSSQGDGACFEGNYKYAKNSVKKVIEFAPKDTELHQMVKGLFEIQKKNFYSITANVKQSGHYYHSRCTDINVYRQDNQGFEDYLNQSDNDAIVELLRDFMNWIYKQLNDDYDYQTSKEAIIETIKANDYDFDEDGNLD
jgi:hypothetical protein